jgi:pyruvate/2-oxoglutarate dehydrogenase complex dihydrolipoamide acyltransferase (E2) component
MLVDTRLLLIQGIIISLYFIGYFYNDHGMTSPRRKLLISTWSSPSNPGIYGTMELNCEIIDNFIEKFNKKNPESLITYTHFFLKLIGKSVKCSKDANGTFAFGQFVPFEDVNITTLVSIGKDQLTGVTITKCDSSSLKEIKANCSPKFKELKKDKNKDFLNKKNITRILPSFLVSTVIHIFTFISYYLGTSIKYFGIKKYSSGSFLFSNLTKLDYHFAFAPLINCTRSAIVFALCKPENKAVVNEKDEIIIRKMINLNMVIDHRYGDAAGLEPLIKEMYRLAANPEGLLK